MKRRTAFYIVVAVVLGAFAYPVAGRAYHGIGLAAPVVVTLVAGFVIGLFSRSWRIALISSWLIGLTGLLGVLVSTLAPTGSGDDSRTASFGGALLIGGLAGAGLGGYLGAYVRARGWTRSDHATGPADPITARLAALPQTAWAGGLALAWRHPLPLFAGVLALFGVLVGPGGPGGSESLSKAAWFAAAIVAVVWLALRPVADLRSVHPAVWRSLTVVIAAFLCWPIAPWILAGLSQVGPFGHSLSIHSTFVPLLAPLVALVLGCTAFVYALVARHGAVATTGRRLASVSSAAGCLLPIAVVVAAMVWFTASMYSCYAVMC